MANLKISAISEGVGTNISKRIGRALITVNDVKIIDVSGYENRGVHALAVDPSTRIVTKDHFKTHTQSSESTRLAKFIADIPAGGIVALAVCGEGAANITGKMLIYGTDGQTATCGVANHQAIEAIKTLGSTKIERLSYLDSWVLIGHKGMLFSETEEQLRRNLVASAEFTHDFIAEIKVSSEGRVDSSGGLPLALGYAIITLNGIDVINVKGEEHRGLHMAVIDEITGRLIEKQYFKTYDSRYEGTRLAEYINRLPDGRVVALAICDEGAKYITGKNKGSLFGEENKDAVEALKKLGSRQVDSLNWRYSWALVGHKGVMRSQTLESLAPTSSVTLSTSFKKRRPILIEAKSAAQSGQSIGEANLTVNGLGIYSKSGDSNNNGLYVTLIDHEDGSVIEHQRFAPSSLEADADKFASYIDAIPAGHIVVVAACGEAPVYLMSAVNRKANVVAACSVLGSTKITQLEPGDSWLLIGQKGATKTFVIQEKRTPSVSVSLSMTIVSRSTSLENIENTTGISSRITLAEDFETGSEDKPIPVHRAIVSLPRELKEAELTAAQDLDVQINGKAERLSPVKPLRVTANKLGKIVITMKAGNLSVPAIKVHTAKMAHNESYIVNIDSHAYHKLKSLPRSAFHDARKLLGIKDDVTELQCGHIQAAIGMLASAHHSTYNDVPGANGVCRDRIVRPDNMEHFHWELSSLEGVKRLSQQTAYEKISKATYNFSAGQFFGESFLHAIGAGSDVIVHTVETGVVGAARQGVNLVQTVNNLVSDEAATIKNVVVDQITGVARVGNDLVHGNITGAVTDIYHLESKIVGDIMTGGENIAAELQKGARRTLAIAVNTGAEMVQYALDRTGKLGEIIKAMLERIAKDGVNIIENVLAWLARKIGWDDIVKLQKVMEKKVIDGLDKLPTDITKIKEKIKTAIISAKKNASTEIQSMRRSLDAGTQKYDQAPASHLVVRAALNNAKEETDWVMSKTTDNLTSSGMFTMPAMPDDLSGGLDKVLTSLKGKLDGDSVLLKAINNVEDDFLDLFAGPLTDAPRVLLRIVLDIAEIVTEGILDLVDALLDEVFALLLNLVDYFKNLIKQTIELPVISNLYKKLTMSNRSAGDQLTVLGFSTLLVAIPAKLISQYHGVNLASKVPSLGQSLTDWQFLFGMEYAGCQVVDGLLSTILDVSPPDLMADDELEISDYWRNEASNIAANRAGKSWPGQIGWLAVVNSLLAQGAFGTPTGDLSIYTPWHPVDLISGIWFGQWLLWVVGIGEVSGKTKFISNDQFRYFFCAAGIAHLVAFLVYNSKDTTGNSQIHFAYFLDPFKSIFQVGRTKAVLEATEGFSYPIVCVTDILFQGSYALFYGAGIAELNRQ